MRRRFADIWFNQKVRLIIVQLVLLAVVVLLTTLLWKNLQFNLKQRGITTGFDFWNDIAGFSIIMHLIDYSQNSTYGRAFWVGLLNTLLISSLGILFATLIGAGVGVARLSSNWLISKCAVVYIEFIRNIPLLLQIFFWYFVVLRAAPLPKSSIVLFNSVFINNRGIYLPYPTMDMTTWSFPSLQGLNFEGGLTILPEFLGLLIALSTYTAAFIAEIIRMGILSVPKGQSEAALALGFTKGQSLRLILIPQALRVILPPLTNQYLNLTKNSSLAAAIAYPDLVSIFAGTILNQTGQAVEIIAITMGVYLFISLNISLLMLLYEKKVEWDKR